MRRVFLFPYFPITLNLYMKKLFIISCLLYVLSGCNEKPSAKNSTSVRDSLHREMAQFAKDIASHFSYRAMINFDSSELAVFLNIHPVFNTYRKDIFKFYSNRQFSYAWYDSTGLIEQSGNLYNRLLNLSEENPKAKIPYHQELDSLFSLANSEEQKPVLSLETELMLTCQYFHMARNIWGGLSAGKAKEMEWLLPRKQVSYEEWLDSMLKNKAAFSGENEPVYRQYKLLKDYLIKYREIENSGGWQPFITKKRSFKKGTTSEVIRQIRKHLFEVGDLQNDTSSLVFDENLEVAVKKFQHRYGLKEDGVIGPAMIREMNQPISNRIKQILVNLERSRWIPVTVSGEYLVVNIPEFRLHVFQDDSVLWNCDVVVGATAHKTAIFSGTLKYIVFSPYWNVPPGILKNEILPGIRRNPNYLVRHNMEWYNGQVRQKPGPNNSLGLVKFLFPNSYNIYLHDTPSKSLFGETKRAFSHGCIRVSEPKRLAMHLLRSDTAWNEQKITEAMHAGKEKYITLTVPVQVYITYFTAWVDRSGQLNFRDDVYKRDERLYSMISDKK